MTHHEFNLVVKDRRLRKITVSVTICTDLRDGLLGEGLVGSFEGDVKATVCAAESGLHGVDQEVALFGAH